MTNDQFRMTKESLNDESSDASEITFWGAELSVVREEPGANASSYDLEERTACFGEAVIDFARTIPQGPLTNRLISQLVGAGTSIGANYCEADDAGSRKEFFLRIGTCRKEARETKYFLRMIVHAVPETRAPARELWDEARQLHLIFCKICRSKEAADRNRPA